MSALGFFYPCGLTRHILLAQNDVILNDLYLYEQNTMQALLEDVAGRRLVHMSTLDHIILWEFHLQFYLLLFCTLVEG